MQKYKKYCIVRHNSLYFFRKERILAKKRQGGYMKINPGNGEFRGYGCMRRSDAYLSMSFTASLGTMSSLKT